MKSSHLMLPAASVVTRSRTYASSASFSVTPSAAQPARKSFGARKPARRPSGHQQSKQNSDRSLHDVSDHRHPDCCPNHIRTIAEVAPQGYTLSCARCQSAQWYSKHIGT